MEEFTPARVLGEQPQEIGAKDAFDHATTLAVPRSVLAPDYATPRFCRGGRASPPPRLTLGTWPGYEPGMDINGLSFHVVDEGSGTPVLLLHGFPDSSRLWRHQIPVLLDAGYRVIAPDLRGFGQSDKPKEASAYAIPILISDVVGILDALGIERAHVVGHDWGAVLAWGLAALLPDRVERLAVLSVGHPSVFAQLPIEQREKSWYMLLFQFEGVAEQLLQRDDWKLMREWLRGDGDCERCLEDLARPGALTAGLNWYRANVAPAAQLEAPLQLPPVKAPTLGIWSSRDHYLIEDGVKCSDSQVSGSWRYERIDGASHWIPVDAPQRLNELLLGFFAEEPRR
jgi:pimeloyl-ACP methyl ester carboxylesterase